MKIVFSLCLAFCLSLASAHSLPFALAQPAMQGGVRAQNQQELSPVLNQQNHIEDQDEDGALEVLDDSFRRQDFTPNLPLEETDAEDVDGTWDLAPEHPIGGHLRRNKRQARETALDLALSHQDQNGNDRPVGRPFGRVDVYGQGQNSRNYHVQGGAGLGSVLWRSDNGRHSVGAGAYVSRGQGRFDGFRYRTRPDVGVGLGYRFRF